MELDLQRRAQGVRLAAARLAAGEARRNWLLLQARGKDAEAEQELGHMWELQTLMDGAGTMAERSTDTRHKQRQREHPAQAMAEKQEQRRRDSSSMLHEGALTCRLASPTMMRTF
jgi:hypothetical protein